MFMQPPVREYRTWIIDSRRWEKYRPRSGDIIVSTYPKCGTTWMQRIVNLLIFQTTEPMPVSRISPWLDRRFPVPIEEVIASLEAQTARRSIKSHLPFDGLPIYDEVSYIHVARDGRDACISFHNHGTGFKPQILEALDRQGLADETIRRPYPRLPADPAAHFHRWITEGAIEGHMDGSPLLSFFEFEKTYWRERGRPNLLLVHYNDLKRDLASEMKRVADFLDIQVPQDLWPRLVEAVHIDTMRRQGATLMPEVVDMFSRGSDTFFYKGVNGRWREVAAPEDLAIYDAKVKAHFSQACAKWLERGCGDGSDPRHVAD
jgi:aryl sulfotransferase